MSSDSRIGDHDFETKYRPAAVCERGHVATRVADAGGVPRYCSTCGVPVLLSCRACHAIIPGQKRGTSGGPYTPPDFCMACGTPFPWLSRQGLLFLLANRILSGELDPAEELVVREQLEALADAELEDDEQVRRWRRVAEAIPSFWERSGAKEIFVRLATETIRRQVGY